jgi:hypothetical protein
MSVSLALAASDCPKLVELADWGENSTGDISVASGGSCLFPIRMRAAAMYSLVVTAKMNGVDLQAWLADILARIAAHPAHRLDELLPWNWIPSASAISARAA